MTNLIKKYNRRSTVMVITSINLPKNIHQKHNELNAISWHSEKTLREISKTHPVLVLAEKKGRTRLVNVNRNFVVERVWQKSNPFSIFALLFTILKYDNVKAIYVPFEFNVFGGILPNLSLLFMLFILKLLGKNVVFEQHQVILEIEKLQKHVNIKNPLAQKFFNFGLRNFYRLLNVAVSQVVVFEEELKRRLSQFIDSEKINTLSLAVKKHVTISKKKAKKQLGFQDKEFVLMVFGFINGYKGIDWLVKEMKTVKAKNIRLLIAGGKNPYLKGQTYYEQFYADIKTLIKKDKRIVKTGFVPDNKIGLYFSAADLVVLPYEVFMSASGPFSLAVSYGKPIIMSKVLADYQLSQDFNQVMSGLKLRPSDLFFNFKNGSFKRLVYRAKNHSSYLARLGQFSRSLAEERSQTQVNQSYLSLFFPQAKAFGLFSKSLMPNFE